LINIIPGFISSKTKQSFKPLTPKSHFTSSVLLKILHVFSDPMFFPPVSETISLSWMLVTLRLPQACLSQKTYTLLSSRSKM